MDYLPHHTAISVRRLDQSLEFYEMLGFKEVHRYMEPDRVGVKLKLGNYFLEIFAFNKNQNQPELQYEVANNIDQVGVKHIALTTEDVDAALADLKAKGLADGTTEILSKGEARFFFIKDPDGMWVEIIKDDRYS